jgi:hypothetical protein
MLHFITNKFNMVTSFNEKNTNKINKLLIGVHKIIFRKVKIFFFNSSKKKNCMKLHKIIYEYQRI